MPATEHTDVYGFWAESRREQPVVPIEGLGRPMWMATQRRDVERVLRDPDRFSSRVNAETMGPVMGRLILAMDGEEHRRHRNLVAGAFRPSNLARWEDELVAPTIERLVDQIADNGRADLVADVTRRYPVQVIAGVLGVPMDDYAQFHTWAEEISLGPEDWQVSMAASSAMREYLTPIVEDRKVTRRDDLVSDIVHAELDGERLDDERIYGFLRLLLPAGAETTYRVMGNCLFALLHRPDVLARVVEDLDASPEAPGGGDDGRQGSGELLQKVIEETLRWETSVTLVNRETTCPVELGGVELPAGASVICALGSANRDEALYRDGDRWNVDRDEPAHLSFGTGRHQCLGMHLARLELRVGLTAVLTRLANLRLDPDAAAPVIEGYAFRSPDRLRVLFDA